MMTSGPRRMIIVPQVFSELRQAHNSLESNYRRGRPPSGAARVPGSSNNMYEKEPQE